MLLTVWSTRSGKLLGDALAGETAVVWAGHSYQFNVDAGVSVDITEFEALVSKAEVSLRAGDTVVAGTTSLAAIDNVWQRGRMTHWRQPRIGQTHQ
jgi:dihydrodipicolinate reductase